MFTEADRQLAVFAGEWYGVFSAWHAAAVGLSPKQRKHRLATGLWCTIHDEVYRHASTRLAWQGTLLAACWAGGFRAVASHRSAAAVWELPGARATRSEVTTPRWRRARHRGIVVHESQTLHVDDVMLVRKLPVTGPARTLLDLASVLHASVLEQAVDEALRKGLVTVGELWVYLGELRGARRRGIDTLRRIVATRHPGHERAESVRESIVLRALDRAGLPAPTVQHEVRRPDGSLVARVDAAYPSRLIAIEYDSYLHHGGRRKFTTDLSRRNELTALGWAVVHVTSADLHEGGRRLVAALRPLIADAT